MSGFDSLKPNQRRAIAALLGAGTVVGAARACGLSEKTIYRYLEDQDFRQALTSAESANIDAAGRRLLSGQDAALDALTEIIKSGNDSNKRLAAVAWVDMALRYREIRNVEERLAELERRVYDKNFERRT